MNLCDWHLRIVRCMALENPDYAIQRQVVRDFQAHDLYVCVRQQTLDLDHISHFNSNMFVAFQNNTHDIVCKVYQSYQINIGICSSENCSYIVIVITFYGAYLWVLFRDGTSGDKKIYVKALQVSSLTLITCLQPLHPLPTSLMASY